MSKLLSEQAVKKKLGIDDFRHLTKDKIISLASMIHRMDPEVAKKALEQFPKFSETTSDILKDYRTTLDKGLESNAESVKVYYDSCNTIIQALERELENEELTFDERKYILEQMRYVAEMIGEKDSENKRFIATMAALGGLVVTVATAYLGATLGGKIRINSDDDDNSDEETYLE